MRRRMSGRGGAVSGSGGGAASRSSRGAGKGGGAAVFAQGRAETGDEFGRGADRAGAKDGGDGVEHVQGSEVTEDFAGQAALGVVGERGRRQLEQRRGWGVVVRHVEVIEVEAGMRARAAGPGGGLRGEGIALGVGGQRVQGEINRLGKRPERAGGGHDILRGQDRSQNA